ncbi:MAG: hypothetical protein OQL19_15945 [Gammaproteobacteria bacterium]|nr:hypothetical protein [Gammaproteobacteria bacterium]
MVVLFWLPIKSIAGTEAGFFNIGHMANTANAVDYVIKNGGNGVEADLRFDSNGKPDRFRHGGPCDCSCGVLGICNVLALEGGCLAGASATSLLNHMASKKELALVVIDSKVSKSDDLKSYGINVIKTLDSELFEKGFMGNVIVGVGDSDTLVYLQSAAEQAKNSPYSSRYYFSIDQGGDDTVGTIEKLISLQPATNNRVYGTGISACAASQYYGAILLGRANQQRGVVGSVYIWTIDKSSSMEQYIRSGTLGIMTNHPSRLSDVVKKHSIKKALPGSAIPTANSTDVIKGLVPCDCDYHPGGCSISKAAPTGFACDCSYKGAWTCGGQNVTCLDEQSPYCKAPDTSIQSCAQGGGDCQGYKSITCDCDYHKGGCTISKAAVPNTACKCKYKGAWTCGGDIDKCKDFSSQYCKSPDKSKLSCLQGQGDCGGY